MSWLLASNIVGFICGFIWTILIARYLQVSEYGILGFATSLSGILAFSTDWGITTYIVRHVSTDYSVAGRYLNNSIPLKTIFSAATLIITLICLLLMRADAVTVTVTVIVTIYMILKSFMGLFESMFQAFEIGRYQGIGNIILNVLTLAFILIAIFANGGLIAIPIAYLLAYAVSLTYEYYIIRNQVAKPVFEFDRTLCRKITIASLPFAAGTVLYLIYYSIDIVMLTGIIGNYATGIYNASYKLISIVAVLQGIYGTVMFPVMSNFFENRREMLKVTFEKSIKYMTGLIIPVALAVTIYSKDIIQVVYGSQYLPSAMTLSILIWTVSLLFINNICSVLLNASHEEVNVTKTYAVAALFNIIMNFIMIPYLSYDGAAITTVLSDLLILIILMRIIYKSGYRPTGKICIDLGKIIIASLVLAAILTWLKLNMWVALPVGIITYLITCYLLRLFDDEDKHIIREIINTGEDG